MRKTSPLSPDIQLLIQKLTERFHPRKVLLFGSYAYGAPHAGSDIDILVIVPTPPKRQEAWKIAAELGRNLSVPLQLVFMSPEEFEETKDVVGGIAYPAYHWGKMLHEADS